MRRTRTSPGRTVAPQVAELRDAPALLDRTLALALTLAPTRWLSCRTLLLCYASPSPSPDPSPDPNQVAELRDAPALLDRTLTLALA